MNSTAVAHAMQYKSSGGRSFVGLTYIGLPEQAVGGFPLGLGLVVEDGPTELSCIKHGFPC